MDTPTTGTRAYVASHFAFELNNTIVGFARKIEGGGTVTEMLDFKHGATMDFTRQPGRIKYTDIKGEFGMGLSPAFYDEIAKFVNREGARLTGAIVTADFNYKERARRTFLNGLISSVGFPALDAAAKEACYMSATIVPETMAFEPGSNQALSCPDGLLQPAKLWLKQNFRFTLHGFEQGCVRATKVDAIEIKQQILQYDVGHLREPIRVAGRLEYPQVGVTVPEVDAGPFYEYISARAKLYHDSVGAVGMTGTIEYLSNDTQSVLATLSFSGADILSVEPQPVTTQGDDIHMVSIKLSVEKMEFAYENDAVMSPS